MMSVFAAVMTMGSPDGSRFQRAERVLASNLNEACAILSDALPNPECPILCLTIVPLAGDHPFKWAPAAGMILTVSPCSTGN